MSELLATQVPDKKYLRLLNRKFASLVSAEVASLRCTEELGSRCLTKQLSQRFPGVKQIDLQCCNSDKTMVQFLKQVAPAMKNLSSLVLAECDLNDAKMPEILKAAVQACPGLKEMHIRTLDCDKALIACCTGLKQLTSMTVAKSVPRLPPSRATMMPMQASRRDAEASKAGFDALAAAANLGSLTLSFPLNVSNDVAMQLSSLSNLISLKLYGLMGCSGKFVSAYTSLSQLSTLHLRGLDMEPEAVLSGLGMLTGLVDLLWHPMPRRLQDLVALDARMLSKLGSLPRLEHLSIRATTPCVLQLPEGSFQHLKSLQVYTPGKPSPLPLLKSLLPLPKLTSLEVLVGVYAPEWQLDEEDHEFLFRSEYFSGLQAQPSHRCMASPLVADDEPGLLPLAAMQPGLQRLVADAACLLPATLMPEHLRALLPLKTLSLHVFENGVSGAQLEQWAAEAGGSGAMQEWRVFEGGPTRESREDSGPWPLSASYVRPDAAGL